jgi:hypothetical protein
LLRSPVALAELPRSLLEQLAADDPVEQMVRLLRFVSPVTTGSAGQAGALEAF